MPISTKPDPERALRQLADDADVDAEMERVLALRPEEVDAELAAAGFDLDAVHEDARRMADKLLDAARPAHARESARPPARVVPIAARAKRAGLEAYASWAAVLAAAAGIAGAWGLRAASLAHAPHDDAPPTDASVASSMLTPDQRQAQKFRAEAASLCAEGGWSTCLWKLDQAKAIDPAGEEASPAILELRRLAERRDKENRNFDPKTGLQR